MASQGMQINNIWHIQNFSDHVIVFVHGVLSDSNSCWKNTDIDPCTYWPDIALGDSRLCEPSIFLGGYYTAIDQGQFDIRSASDDLFSALERADPGHGNTVLSKKAIIFICHSTGGLVVRHMLATKFPNFKNIKIGLILIASPLAGSVWANRIKLLSWLYDHRMAQELKINDRVGREIGYQLREVINDKLLDIVGVEAYESKFIYHWKWVPSRFRVVAEQNLGGLFGAPKQLRDTDHFSIVKPRDIHHPAHQLLVDFFAKHFKESVRAITDVRTTPSMTMSLPQVDSEDVAKHFVGREDILDLINSWIQSDGPQYKTESGVFALRMLWLHGIGGMGKTWALIKSVLEIRKHRGRQIRTGFIDFRREDIPSRPIDFFNIIAQVLGDAYGHNVCIEYWKAREKIENLTARRRAFEAKFDSELEYLFNEWDNSNNLSEERKDDVLLDSSKSNEAKQNLTQLLQRFGWWHEDLAKRRASIQALKRRRYRLDRPISDIVSEWIIAEHPTIIEWESQPNRALANLLRKAIQTATASGRFVLTIDNLEGLDHEFVEWLKYIFLPVLHNSDRLLLMIGSRWAPDAHEQAYNRHSWRSNLSRFQLRIVDFNSDFQLTPREIVKLLTSHNITGDVEALSISISDATRGLPLTIGMILNSPDRHDIIDQLATMELENKTDEKLRDEMVGIVAERFLEELRKASVEDRDLVDIIALTIMGTLSLDFLSRWWMRDDPERRIDELARRYSFMSERRVHSTVAAYWRHEWRKRPLKDQNNVVDDLIEIGKESLRHIPFLSEDWEDRAKEIMNLESWKGRDEGVWCTLKWLCIFLSHDISVQLIRETTEDLQPLQQNARIAKRHILEIAEWQYFNFSDKAWSWLAEVRPPNWTPEDFAYLHLVLAMRYDSSPAKVRWQWIEAASSNLPAQVFEDQSIATSILDISRSTKSALSQERALVLLGENRIMEWGTWSNDFYWILHDRGDFEKARQYCLRILEVDKTNVGSRTFLAHLLAVHLGRTLEAEWVLREGLKLRPREINFHAFLADTLVMNGKLEAAVHHYNQAKLGASDRDCARLDSKIIRIEIGMQKEKLDAELRAKVVRQIGNQSNSADDLNTLAWGLYISKVEVLDLAESAARRSVALSQSEYNMHTLVAILIRRDVWPEAGALCRQWLAMLDPKELKRDWADYQSLFEDAQNNGRMQDIIQMLQNYRGNPYIDAIISAVNSSSEPFINIRWPMDYNESFL